MSNFTLTDGKWKGVQINPTEAQALLNFIDQHYLCDRDISIEISNGPGIGQRLCVVDCAKHEKSSQTDITDYSVW